MKREPTEYTDRFKMVGKYLAGVNGIDGGDTAHRIGLIAFGVWALRVTFGKEAAEDYLKQLELPRHLRHLESYEFKWELLESEERLGVLVRHPDKSKWYSEPNRMSRDQSNPNLAAMTAFMNSEDYLSDDEFTDAWNLMRFSGEYLRRYFKSHATRGFLFTTNTRRNGATPGNHGIKKHEPTSRLKWYHKLILEYRIPLLPVPDGYKNYNWKLPDLTGPGIWSMYVRAFGEGVWTKPVLSVLDLELLIAARMTRNKDDSDVGNHVASSLLAAIVKPTPVSRYVNNHINNFEDLSFKLKDYFNDHREPWFIYDIYEPLMKHYFKG